MLSETAKTTLIVILAVLALIGCFALVIYLLSNNGNNNSIESNDSGNDSYNYAIEVIDGDTFAIDKGEIIRLLCVDTPEEGDSGYAEAKNYLSSIIISENGNLTIERRGLDKYNRTLAWVYVGGLLINKELIDNELGTLFEYEGMNCSRVSN